MDFSYFQNIMEPNDFAELNKFSKYSPSSFLRFVGKYPKIIDLMLEYFKANPKKINEYNDIYKYFLLVYAIMYSLAIKNICELHVNVNHRNADGWTALTYAVYNNNINAIKVLLEYDATINIVTSRGKTAFDYGPNKKKLTIMVENIRFLNIKN